MTPTSSRRRGLKLGLFLALGALLLDSPLVSAQDAQQGQEDQQSQQNQGRRRRSEDRARQGGERGPGSNRGPGANRRPGSDRGPDGNRGAGRDRGPGGGRGPNGNRGPGGGGDRGPGGGPGGILGSIRGLPPGPITPEMREQFYNRVSEGHFRRLTDIYALTEDQKAQVKEQLKTITQKQREFTDPIIKDVESMFRERFSLEGQRRAGQAIDENRLQQITDGLRQLRDQSPLMNFDNVANEVEQTLPAEQVAQGQQRRSESRAREEARREEWRQRREEMRAQREAQRQQEQQQQAQQPVQQPEQGLTDGQTQAQSEQSPPSDQPQGRDPRSGRQRRFQRTITQDETGQEQGQGQEVQGGPQDERDRRRESRGTGDPWDDYVNAFIRRYHLDESQQSSARSLLRTYKNERQQYRDARKTDYAAAEALESESKRRDEIERLNKGIERLFDSLKEKLERIPTDDQLTKYGSRRRSSSERENAASRPAADSPPQLPATDNQPAASAQPAAQPAAASQPG